MVKPTIRVLFTLALAYGWSLRQVDINNALLHGLLNEVYMSQPSCMIDPSAPTMVSKFKKALYGVKQAPRAWFERLISFLNSLGFVNSKADSSLLVYHKHGLFWYMWVILSSLEDHQRLWINWLLF